MTNELGKVAVVSPGAGMALLLRLVLRREGYEVRVFDDVKALDGFADEMDAVVVDLEPAEVLGPEPPFAETKALTVPVVVLTGGDARRVRRETGAAAVVEKPFDASQLMLVLREVVAPETR